MNKHARMDAHTHTHIHTHRGNHSQLIQAKLWQSSYLVGFGKDDFCHKYKKLEIIKQFIHIYA